jgi:hypothetical protein
MAPKKKTFDALAASRRRRRKTSRLVRGMKPDERRAFFNRRLEGDRLEAAAAPRSRACAHFQVFRSK